MRAELVERILSEGPIGLTEAAAVVGHFRDGKQTHTATLSKWVNAGVRVGADTVRLEAIKVAGRLVTSRAAIVRFIAAQNATPDPSPAPRTKAARHRAVADASARLAVIGA